MHDIVVIGGAGGSFGTIKRLLGDLPKAFPATIFIVNHTSPSIDLLDLYKDSSPLPVRVPKSGERLQRGQVYVPPHDAHLLVHDDHAMIKRGPRENFSRPAIDPLFRSAASACRGRVIGILLSGALNDGVAGLAAIRRCGGLIVVQDPTDAEIPAMPESALQAVVADYCVPASEMAALLCALVDKPAPDVAGVPSNIELEVAIAASEPATMKLEDDLGEKSAFSCPDCDGVLWQVHDENLLRFRCHVGHAVTAEALFAAKAEAADDTLWRLLRLHQERAAIARTMAADARKRQQEDAASNLDQRSADYEEDASTIRRLLIQIPRERDS